MSNRIDALFDGNCYDHDTDRKTHLSEAVLEELRFHYDNNELYKNFCEYKGFDPKSFTGDLDEIPPIEVHVFKTLGEKLNSVPFEKIRTKLQSSATSGQPSTVLIDGVTAKRQVRAMVNVMGDYIGKERKHFYVADVDPASASASVLGARSAAIRGYLNFAQSVDYLVEASEGNDFLVNEDIVNAGGTATGEKPAVVFGFTYMLYKHLVLPLYQQRRRFPLPSGSKVIHIGGWKKLEGEKVSKEVFNLRTAEVFDIDPRDVIDIYGFSEQMGLNYPDCCEGWKHVPVFSRVIVRDPVSRRRLEPGQPGLLEFVTPIPHSYPGNAVITDDVGVLAPDEPCPCGRGGLRFRILGRAKKAEVRGCGDILADKIIRPQTPASSAVRLDHKLDVLFSADGDDTLSGIVDSLRQGQKWLVAQHTDALIGLIDKTAQIWADPTYELSGFRERGLGFLQDWCNASNLSRLADFSLRGRRGHLDGFLPIDDSVIRNLRAVPRGLVCHWLSGNVPVLGMLTLVQSIIARNANLLKVASSYTDAVPTLLRSFEGVSYVTPSGRQLHGDDLLKSIAAVYFDRNDVANAETMSGAADVRLAWGGSEAVTAVTALPKKWAAQDIVFGPKLSFMVIGRDALETDRQIKKICRRAATDASVFDQSACASPHTIFVERGGNLPPREFAARLATEMEKAATRIPRTEDNVEQLAKITTVRAVYEFIGAVWKSADETWTVLYDEKQGLADPTYSRVITVRPVDDISDTLQYASEDIQTIGLAASGGRKLAFAEQASLTGVERCPDIGMMTNFESPWDGMIVMDRLVRWSTFGGPAQ
jgi:hypothetical protein